MGDVLLFHARASAGSEDASGYRSGRSSCRDTPDTRSTASTRRGGTSSHCEIACAVMPSGTAKPAKPPTASIARFKASLRSVMAQHESIAFQQNQALLHCEPKVGLYNVDMTLGSRISAARDKAGLTQKQLGKYFGISGQAVSQWERNLVSPEIDKLGKLCVVLKIPSDWLLKGGGPPPDQDEISALLGRLDPASHRRALRILRSMVEDDDQAA